MVDRSPTFQSIRAAPVSARGVALARATPESARRLKRWNRFSKAVGTSWRVDETYISIKAKWHYLYRAVDKHGKTVDFLLRRDRGIAAAQAFFRQALASTLPRVPRKVTLDGHMPSRRALQIVDGFNHHRQTPGLFGRIQIAVAVEQRIEGGFRHFVQHQAGVVATVTNNEPAENNVWLG